MRTIFLLILCKNANFNLGTDCNIDSKIKGVISKLDVG